MRQPSQLSGGPDATLAPRPGFRVRIDATEPDARQLLQAMDKGVLVQNAEGRIVSANPAACRILGMTEVEITGIRRDVLQHWRLVDEHGQRIDFEDLPGLRALRTGVSVDSTIFGVYLPHLHLYRWLSSSSVPQFRAGESRPFQVISTFSDVTALKRQAELFEQTQQLTRIGGWEIDDLLGTLYWTTQVYRIHDLEPDSAITEVRALDFFAPADRHRLQTALSEARAHSRAFQLDLPLTTAIGRRRWVRIIGQPQMLDGRIRGVTGTLQDITERRLEEEQLRRLAASDRVTGLANRDTLMEALQRAIDSADDRAGPGLLFIDLDRFHLANDTAGHAEGDRLLVEAAERLSACAGGTHDLAARMSGDEFVLLLPGIAGDAALQACAERVVEAFRKPFRHDGEEFVLTASVGAVRHPQDGADAQQLVNHADAAMAEAKRRGRNTWQRFNAELAAALTERTRIERHLRRALHYRELRLVYQPVFALEDLHVAGAEALLRWRNRALGDVPPTQFIGHAENSGEIVRIGAWVIAEACRQWRIWRDAGIAPARIAVNVSFRQLLSGSLLDTVRAALERNALPRDTLALEMTERALIEDAADTVETFRQLRALGVRLLIDDFGEGYSSLNYLRRLPLDGLKISHAFMHGIPDNPADSAIGSAIIHLAGSLGLSVTAEGVETAAQHAFLRSLHAPYAQGFLFARPMESDAMGAYLAGQRPAVH